MEVANGAKIYYIMDVFLMKDMLGDDRMVTLFIFKARRV